MGSPPHTAAPSRRERLRRAQIMLIFTPELCEDPEASVRALWPHVDAIQVRPKPLGAASSGPAEARATLMWAETLLRYAATQAGPRPLLLVNDRVDVAQALAEEGIDGVHLGQDDTPPRVARDLLGPEALIGWSTHDYEEVRRAQEEPVDYLGFGAIFPTETKAGTTANHCVNSWVASASGRWPVFPIGGITVENAWQLAPVGRVAIGAGLLRHPDPAGAAQTIRRSLRARGPQDRRHDWGDAPS